MSSLTPLSTLIAGRRRHDDRVSFDIAPDWLQGRTSFGGLISTLAVQAMRDVAGSAFAAEHAEHSFDFVTADLSFITSTHVLPTMVSYLKPGGDLLLLVKPQFELQPAQIGKGGIVKDPAHFVEVENRLWQACKAQGLKVQQYFKSPIQGGHGNTEFFVWAKQPA